MYERLARLVLLAIASGMVVGCGDNVGNVTATAADSSSWPGYGDLELSQEVTGSRATGNRYHLLMKILDTRWYYAVLTYRKGAQRIVPVELQSDRATVIVNGYPDEEQLGLLRRVKVYSRPLSDLSYKNPPHRYTALSPDEHGKSLVLIHGYLGTRLSMTTMRKALRKEYDHVFVYCYQYNDYLAASGAKLSTWLSDLNITGPGKRCDIVAHCLGGLVAREAIEHRGLSTYVDTLVMLSTPHQGSTWALTPAIAPLSSLLLDSGNWMSGNYFTALYQYFFNAVGHVSVLSDLQPDSTFLSELNEPSHVPCTYVTIGSELAEWGGDLVVTPDNANWSGLGNEAAVHESRTLALGHSQLLSHKLACNTVKELLSTDR